MQHKQSLTIISASNALTKWLKIDLSRMPGPDSKHVGTQSFITDSETISWQCHVVQNGYRRDGFTVIAVEAYSRFTLLIPFDFAPTQMELQRLLCERWVTMLVSLMVKHGEIGRDQVPVVFSQFHQKMVDIQWWRNTDLSVNGHVSDAEQWVKQTIEGQRIESLSEDEAVDLAMHINQFFKRAKDKQGKKQRFYPIPRFVEDGLYRFASGLFNDEPFPSPYPCNRSVTPLRRNVVSLADYVVGKRK